MKKKNTNKLLSIIALVALTIIGFGSISEYVKADDEEPLTNLVITKIDMGEKDPNYDGLQDFELDNLKDGIDDIKGWFGDNAKELPGVEFEVYEVTEEADFEKMLKDSEDFKTKEDLDDSSFETKKIEGTYITNEKGQVTVSDLAEGFYWVIEVPQGTVTGSRAVPFGISLPFTNKNRDGYLKTIHVYPKNTLADGPKSPDKKVEGSGNVAIGENITWEITATAPKGIKDYDKFIVVDELDYRLTYVDDTVNPVKVQVGKENFHDSNYEVNYEEDDHTLTIDFQDGLKNLDDKDIITITFKTFINDTAIMGGEIENEATIKFNNGHIVDGDKETEPGDPGKVHTGGKAFVKVDGATGKSLEGAEFIMQNDKGKYIQVSDDKKEVTFVDSEDDATPFTSDGEGKFEIKGLPYNEDGEEYILIETKAPGGYALPTNSGTKFNVGKYSYYNDPTKIEEGDAPANEGKIKPIENTKMSIPQTGGIGTALFTVIGGALMVLSVLYYRRSEKA